jgi:hypothetical protein
MDPLSTPNYQRPLTKLIAKNLYNTNTFTGVRVIELASTKFNHHIGSDFTSVRITMYHPCANERGATGCVLP